MKTDANTLELPGLPPLPKKRGRPATGTAMSPAERQRKYRQSHKPIDLGERMGETVRKLAEEFDLSINEVARELIRFALCNRNWKQTGFCVRERNGN